MTPPPLTPNAWLRYGLIQRLLRDLRDVRSVLEVGAGEGALGARLARRFSYTGLEPDPVAYERARRRIEELGLGRVIRGTVADLEQGERFDVVCAFEVLEHMEDDRATLLGWKAHLRPGGWVLLSVPAHARRFGPSDHAAGHFRRYDREDLVTVLTSASFSDVVVWAYGFPLGYALEFVRNQIVRRMPQEPSIAARTARSGRLLQPPVALGAAIQAMALPFRAAQLPFRSTVLGTGFVARARSR